MDHESSPRRVHSQEPTRNTNAALNNKHHAWICGHEVFVTSLHHPDSYPEPLSLLEGLDGPFFALTLSDTQPDLLALASSQVDIVDTTSGNCLLSVRGIGRAITALAFPYNDADQIATGHIDGSICTWRLSTPDWPQRRLLAVPEACKILAFSRLHPEILASVSHDVCHVWNLKASGAWPLCTVRNGDSRITAMAWSCSGPTRLALSFTNHDLRVYDLEAIIHQPSNDARSLHSPDGNVDDEIFERSNKVSTITHSKAKLVMNHSLASVSWVGSSTLLGLTQDGRSGLLLRVSNDDSSTIDAVWSCDFENIVEAISLQDVIFGSGRYGVQYHVIPREMCKEVAPDASSDRDVQLPNVGGLDKASGALHGTFSKKTSNSAMKPISFAQLECEGFGLARTSRQLQKLRTASRRNIKPHRSISRLDSRHERQTPEPSNDSMTSSLELPSSGHREDIGSPMPFLSPSIPSRRVSPNDIPPLNDDIMAKPAPMSRPSFESSMPSAATAVAIATDGDDSDDESYVVDLQRSVTFLPGGINVPLPKACGALFTPNGQLLTFFPPRQQYTPPRGEAVETGARPRKTKKEAIAKLFPGFGNMESYVGSRSGASSMDSSVISDEDGATTFQKLILPVRHETLGDQSYAERPTSRPTSDDERRHAKLIVSIYGINDIHTLGPLFREAAQGYRVLCKDGESGAQLCAHNANVALDAGLREIADAWWILSRLLEDRVPLQSFSLDSREHDLVVVARRLQLLTQDETQAALVSVHDQHEVFGKIRWTEHPFSADWLVRRLFQWAEARADVQYLACAAAILSQAKAGVPLKARTAEQSMLEHLPAQSADYFTHFNQKAFGQAPKGTTPLLCTNAAVTSPWDESPTKAMRDIAIPGRSTSEPHTPHIDSDSPRSWMFPPAPRQGARISASGSASPEVNRGSFSAAVKNYASSYAQSMSDKVASYGSTPPASKSNAASAANGAFSSSMPTGSWPGKSVSFASTTTTDEKQANSWTSRYSFADADDGNDSDKTVEDGSTPRTPRSPGGAICFLLSNEDKFADEVSGSAKAGLIPHDLQEPSKAWCLYYADLLRSWEMHIRAAEFEKVAGLSGHTALELEPSELSNDGVQPVFSDGRRKTSCTICEASANGLVQMCPLCLHVSHFGCVQEYVAELKDEAFSCPAGCGCTCAELPYVVQATLEQQSATQPRFKKKPSLTDPMRWRARLQGDGWD